MIVLGIDPGTANTGYGVVAQQRRAPGRARRRRRSRRAPGLDAGARGWPRSTRASRELIDEHRPDAVAVEDLYFGANARSAFAVGQARGVVLLAAGQRGVPCCLLHAAAGQGRGLRLRPRRPRTRCSGWSRRCSRCAELPRPDHAADALAVAICHANGAPLRARRCGRPRVIALLAGEVAVRRADHVVVSCGGVGYRLAVSAETLRHVPARRASRSTLHTHLIVRDDALLLYGFATEEERDLFLLLIGVQSRRAEGGARRALGRHAARAARRRRGRRHRAPPGRAGHRQAHGRADRRRAAREGRRRAAPTTRSSIARGDDPRLLAREGLRRPRLLRPGGRRAARRRRRARRPRT